MNRIYNYLGFRCLNNGKYYLNAEEAIDDLCLPNFNSSRSSIYKVANKELKSHFNYVFTFIIKEEDLVDRRPVDVQLKKCKNKPLKFKCHQNGKVYNSRRECADDLFIAEETISRQLFKGLKRSNSGYTFELVEEEEEKVYPREIIEIKSNKKYKNLIEASRKLSIDSKKISRNLRFQTNSVGDLEFRYVNEEFRLIVLNERIKNIQKRSVGYLNTKLPKYYIDIVSKDKELEEKMKSFNCKS